jgi:hypothetical protein
VTKPVQNFGQLLRFLRFVASTRFPRLGALALVGHFDDADIGLDGALISKGIP